MLSQTQYVRVIILHTVYKSYYPRDCIYGLLSQRRYISIVIQETVYKSCYPRDSI